MTTKVISQEHLEIAQRAINSVNAAPWAFQAIELDKDGIPNGNLIPVYPHPEKRDFPEDFTPFILDENGKLVGQ